MYKRTILCFANSWKTGGTCVAGKELLGTGVGGWIRPVSSRPTQEIAVPERRYKDGTLADVLHVIEVPLLSHSPLLHQTENHVIDASRPWRKSGSVTWAQVQASLDNVAGALWLNGHSTIHGRNDKIPLSSLAGVVDSLRLVGVTDLTLHVALEPGWQGAPPKRKVRGSFSLNGHHYRLAVTDPLVTDIYRNKEHGDYPIGTATLCVSLSQPEYGHAFKLIASVFTAHRCGGV
jgi:hypothetical protein